MNIESQLANAIVRIGQRQPDIRETLIETLFMLRRERWAPLPRRTRHADA